jgi:zinc transport system permease protein
MIVEALSLEFFQRIVIAGLFASVVAGVVGTFIVVKRMSSVTGGLAHAAFGGVGLGYLLGFPPIFGAAIFGLASGLGVGIAYRRLRTAMDTSISMVWAAGMALGVIFISLAPGYAPDLTSYLFGSILFASWEYVATIAVLDGVVLLTVTLLFNPLKAVSFDEEFAEVMGLPVDRLLLLLLALVSLSVVTLIRVVGVILAIALLTVPAATARHWTSSLHVMIALAVTFAASATLIGLFGAYGLGAAYDVSLPSGPLIILTSVTGYGVSLGLSRLRLRRLASHSQAAAERADAGASRRF